MDIAVSAKNLIKVFEASEGNVNKWIFPMAVSELGDASDNARPNLTLAN